MKNPPVNAGDARNTDLIAAQPRHGNPLQYSCLENPTDRGTWWAAVHRVAKSGTWLKKVSTHTVRLSFFHSAKIYTL